MKHKYFGTDGVRGRVGDHCINPELILKLGWAVGTVLASQGRGRGKALIGKDTRISGYMLESSLEAGLSAAGVDIHLLGPMPTPAIAYLTRTLHADIGIVISASHNPSEDNGIKFFSGEGTKLPDASEAAIEACMEMKMETTNCLALGRAFRVDDAQGRYIEYCKSTVPWGTRLHGMKIVLDCANGATYHIAPAVFDELGATVILMNTQPDGFNINHECGSLHPELLRNRVLEESADVGIAFDGDGDRLVMVDHQGDILDGDELLWVMSKHFNRKKRLGGGVVGTVMSNFGLELALKSKDIPFVRTKVGDRYILETLQEKNWLLGGETSGHIIWKAVSTTGDGIVAALQILRSMYRHESTLADLKKGMTKLPQTMINIPRTKTSDPLASSVVQKLINEVEKELAGQGRVLLRPSGTEAVLRVMVEGENEKQVNQLANQLAERVRSEV